MKKVITYLLIFILLFGNTLTENYDCCTVLADISPEIKVGDYIQLGKYKDDPILWRYIDEDENGKLFLSDKILCYKSDYDNFWEESFIRKWLNSTVSEGEVDWFADVPNLKKDLFVNVPYAEEKGFLHKDNFTSSERSVMKTVTQWTMLPREHVDKATNENDKPYTAVKSYWGSPRDGFNIMYYDITEIPEIYSGAAYQLEDTVFSLNEIQAYHLWENFGTIIAQPTEKAVQEIINGHLFNSYWLRTPSDGPPWDVPLLTSVNRSELGDTVPLYNALGIRPAFYLNDENAVKLSGSGTEEEPYILTGKESEEIGVFCNGTKLEFDQTPIMEGDRVLVPMRVIFETLGADVEWNGEILTATAVRGETTISLQIDSNIMYKNGEAIELDVPARLLNDRTLVPIRAVSEAMEAKVEWNQEDKAVVITTE